MPRDARYGHICKVDPNGPVMHRIRGVFEIKEKIAEEGYDPEYGARPMRRSVEKHLEDPLAEHLLRGDVKDGDHVVVTIDKKENKLKFKAKKSEPIAEKA